MKLTVLSVPGCPNAEVLDQRLREVLGERDDVQVVHRIVENEVVAAQVGMHGSPTLLIDGRDPFARPGQQPSVSCRLYRGQDTAAPGVPSLAGLRAVLGGPSD